MQLYKITRVFSKKCETKRRSIISDKAEPILKNNIMKTNVVGYWNYKKEKLKQKFDILTEKDLSYNEGKEKEMIELLGYKLGKTKQELLSIIVSL